MYFILKRFKGAVSYTEFYEMYDDDLFALYRKEGALIKEEEAEYNKNKGNSPNNSRLEPEPSPAPESEEMVDYLDGLFD